MEILYAVILWIYYVQGERNQQHEPVRTYSRECLMRWDNPSMGDLYLDPLVTEDILAEIFRHRSPGNYRKNVCKERKRGRSGGVRLRLKCQRLHRIPLPSIRLANVQSLRNKTDELQANSNYLHEYRNACIMAFSETWLSSRDSDADLSISGFGAPVRLDRDAESTGKSQGGGVCIYINQRWCSNITVRESICTADIELLSISVRPFYLPREFPQIFVTVVYIHPKANTQTAADTIHKVIQRLQSLSPDAPCLLMGDFNNCKLYPLSMRHMPN